MNTNTGGPAFPHHIVCDKGWAETQELQGMTLRDYFAAKAMQGFIGTTYEEEMEFDEVALAAYKYSDAMLKARKE